MNLHLCQKDYLQMLIDENPLICACHNVSLRQILAFLPHHTECSVAEMVAYIQQQTWASTGCGSCLSKVQGIAQCYVLKPVIFSKNTQDSTGGGAD